MKKHLSVLALYAGNDFLRLLALVIAMGVLETALFALRWNSWDFERQLIPAVENLLQGVALISALTLLALLFLLCCSGDTAAYTLRRLRISEEAAVLWKAAYNCLCLLLLWAVQTAVAMGLCAWYTRAIGPEYSTSQTVFLAFCRVPFLHNLLPLGSWPRYLRNIVLLLSMGFCAAVRTYKVRRGSRFGWGIGIFLWGVTNACFRDGISTWFMDVIVMIAALIAAAVDADYFIKEWRGEWHETD